MAETVDIIGTLIDSLRETSTISNVAVSGSNYTFTTADLKSLVVKDEVIILTKNYSITAIDSVLKKFTVSSTVNLSAATSWKAASPYYWYGTPTQVNLEFIAKSKPRGIFVFLFETIRQIIDNSVTSAIDRTAEIDMYFMKFCNNSDWKNSDHYTNVIKIVTLIIDNFIELINNDKQFDLPENMTKINYSDWGSYLKDKGFVDRILDQKFSGIGLNLNLPIRKIINCV